jgi:hypothetical protein
MIPDYKLIIGGIKMSRTYRRKKVSDSRVLEMWCIDPDLDCNCSMIGCGMKCPYKNKKKTIRKYHRETRSGFGWNGNVPSDYRRMMAREYRAKMKAETNRILKQGDYENYSFDKMMTDYGWMYW